MKVACIIPARWGSTRFPGKPLALIAGKPLIRRVWEQCRRARKIERLVIATDDPRIADVATAFGAEIAWTRPDHATGTDRIAEVALTLPDADAVVNVQGDEPLIDPVLIDRLADALSGELGPEMVTAASPITDAAELENPNIVKVVLSLSGDALYFSRSRIPFLRDPGASATTFRHQGIYGYQRDFLLRFVQWPQGILENAEQLEQLRALENGARIRVILTEEEAHGVDLPADIAFIEERLRLAGNA